MRNNFKLTYVNFKLTYANLKLTYVSSKLAYVNFTLAYVDFKPSCVDYSTARGHGAGVVFASVHLTVRRSYQLAWSFFDQHDHFEFPWAVIAVGKKRHGALLFPPPPRTPL